MPHILTPPAETLRKPFVCRTRLNSCWMPLNEELLSFAFGSDAFSGIIFGLSAALYGEIVVLVQSQEAPGGIGEPGPRA